MAVHILHDKHHGMAIMYCTTTDWAFGPVFNDGEHWQHDAADRAEGFLRWLRTRPSLVERDPRRLTDQELEAVYSLWLSQESEQWQAEAKAREEEYQ